MPAPDFSPGTSPGLQSRVKPARTLYLATTGLLALVKMPQSSPIDIRIINLEFKDLAQTWGWKMIAAHGKMYP
ncbi:MAG TPA: hypothetical protein VFE27_12725 [Acidobacteriaceae bacterium]|nr:hypothetical protein [Acidobacteriaceae bacterium]